ncbi:MAG: N-acyl-D-amino-acid deacylase [Candidatus Jorgensenbacteria bacterium GW2011_GWA1_48_11]|uniref:N-acyl-D-amino-acid deacylase n=1 Tax=Candidatus Jorgensenbacteria bacterium GW2011_GWA1_48_11 TaxID=1618660 RepID=A0A0G1UB06_9BACT|nr:MAG: N-acyl-D-amino-acid deacylase [Candidatus Jorgensenbacteria bacterium GW2011_GWA1_48_11]KKW12742.1 MAG: N-acyl-D-amino-acid deacylase [Candidatus Jorgensenbacteria bacterium GW2011_GWB1_49_9]
MTLLIKNGLVYDGSEKAPEKSDIFISGKKIVRIGQFPALKADVVIDASGALVLPGFIDIGSTIDHYFEVFSEPVQERLIANGITTVIGGNDGFSLAPFTRKSYFLMNEMGDNHYRNADWHSVGSFLNVLGRKRLRVNFGTLAGHTTIRESLTKGEPRDLTDHELLAIRRILAQSFKDGAFGFSINLNSIYSRRVPLYEIESLAEATASGKKIFALGLRQTGEKLSAAIEEMITIAKKTSVNVQLRRFAPVRNFVGAYLEAKEIFEKSSAETHVNFDLNLSGLTVMPIHDLLPDWFRNSNLEDMVRNIESAAMREVVFGHLAKFDLAKIRIIRAPRPLKFLETKTLRDFAASRNLHDAPAILKFMQLTHLQSLVGLENVDLKTAAGFLDSPKAIASADVLTDAFTVLINSVLKDGLMPLEKAVTKMTLKPAEKYRIPLRGLLKEGYFADVVVVADGRVRDVVLNGELAFNQGRSKNKTAGMVLRPAR